MKLQNNNRLNADVQAIIEPPPIPLLEVKTGNTEETHIIKINMRQEPASATYNTYEFKVQTFENAKLEEFL